ncbi:MAG: PA2779 family protein [Limnobacter sp.]|nr:PA2779 family protein [Limnobacter sp.]
MKNLAAVFAVAFTASTAPLPAMAAMVPSETALATQQIDRSDLKAFFDRQDVVDALKSHGVTAEMAKKRVDSMTDAEAQRLAQHIESEPAGAGVIGVLFTVFIVLLVTDILGLTKVFPFTRSVR